MSASAKKTDASHGVHWEDGLAFYCLQLGAMVGNVPNMRETSTGNVGAAGKR
jgi:hypothetical protein